MTKLDQPTTARHVVDRAEFHQALAAPVAKEKEATRHNDRVPADRRRLPMVEVQDYTLAGPMVMKGVMVPVQRPTLTAQPATGGDEGVPWASAT